MFRHAGKKGQEGVTLTTLLLIVLGAVVVVTIILGATGAFDYIFGTINISPGQDLQKVVTSCEIAGANGLKADYCLTFKKVEINGAEQYVTCDYDLVKSGMTDEGKANIKVTCDEGSEKSGINECQRLNEKEFTKNKVFDEVACGKSKLIVNGVECKSVCYASASSEGTTATSSK